MDQRWLAGSHIASGGSAAMLKIPYGISNFEALITGGYLYVDKTRYIRELEDIASFVLLVRPRRFGKSLFVSMLGDYYDLAKAEAFEGLFGQLDIGRTPTELRNRFLVLKLDFSPIETSQGAEALRESFRESVAYSLQRFATQYRPQLGECRIDLDGTPEGLVHRVLNAVLASGQRMCVLIDEYDNFANDLLARGERDIYRDMVEATGFVRTFYKTLKAGTTSVIDRIFVTGVSPVMLDALTSGFNIAENVSLDERVHEAFGFTESELRDTIRRLELSLEEDRLVDELATLYNGYRFSEDAQDLVYNTDMALYYLKAVRGTGKRPKNLIDHNVRTDYGRLRSLALSNPANTQTIQEIIAEESIQAELIPQFSFDLMYDEQYFPSLLFYLGMLSIGEVTEGLPSLRIPNYAIKTLYWEYFRKLLAEQRQTPLERTEVSGSIQALAWRGEIEPFAQYVANEVLQKLSRRDFIRFDEKHIKVILFSLLGLTDFYLCHSEREVEHGFLDLFLSRAPRFPELPFEWLLELKYLKETERGQLAAVREQAEAQLRQYAASREIRSHFRGEAIRLAALIFIGKGDVEILTP